MNIQWIKQFGEIGFTLVDRFNAPSNNGVEKSISKENLYKYGLVQKMNSKRFKEEFLKFRPKLVNKKYSLSDLGLFDSPLQAKLLIENDHNPAWSIFYN